MTGVDALAAEVLAALRERSEPARREATRKYIPTELEVLGVKTPDLRAVVRAFKPRLGEEDGQTVVALARSLVDAGTLEGRQAAYELVEQHRAARESLSRRDLEALGHGMDNWAAVDGFAVLLAGVAWREGRIGDDVVLGWLAGGDRWWRRAAVVATVPLNMPSRGGTGDPARTLDLCRRVVDDRDDMMVKAVSWALRTLAKQDPAPVRGFLEDLGDRVAPRVRREVTNKLDRGLKNP